MKNFLAVVFMCFLPLLGYSQNDYYFPKGVTFDASIPSPEQFLGYPVGEWHTRVDRIVAYFEKLSSVSSKAHFQIIGYTTEHRPQVVLTISDPVNIKQLESIRQKHLLLSQPGIQVTDLDKMPVIVQLGYGIHGNEASSAEAAMLTAYYLLAEQSQETAEFLKNAIINIDPVHNPDGRDRYSTWANMYKAFPPVSDPLDREHNEAWPGSRTNHYCFDLNRDWFPLTQKESLNRVAFYQQWRPNVATDFHEMGTNATYFFEPTKAGSTENPLVPLANYNELSVLFAKHFIKAMDEIGSLYYARETFDNLYPGYGSTYPDLNGGLGLLFEQASSRGHVQRSETEDVSFAFTIRNQTRNGIATVRAAIAHRLKLHEYQRDFFHSAVADAEKSKTKAWIFGAQGDQTKLSIFIKMLERHKLKTYHLKSDLSAYGKTYTKGDYFIVPAAQPQYRMAHSIFEPFGPHRDSVFYDASSWVLAMAYNLDYARLSVAPVLGEEVSAVTLKAATKPVEKAPYAWLISWSDLATPSALNYLLSYDVNVKTAFKPFATSVNGQKMNFSNGTLLIPVADQSLSHEKLWELMKKASELAGIQIIAVSSGANLEGPDLGSSNFKTVKKPKVAILVGDGISSYEAGEVWYLLDNFVKMQVTKINIAAFANANLYEYNTLVMTSGNYNSLDEKLQNKLKDWVSEGNTLIALRSATSWAIEKKLVNEKLRQPSERRDSLPVQRRDYIGAAENLGSRRIGGIILQADLDITHPLGFGFSSRNLPVYRNHEIFVEPAHSAYSTVAQYTPNPLLDGYIHPENLKLLSNTASLLVSRVGNGRAVLFVDNPNFRGFWHGTGRLFTNALFFGSLINVPE